MYIYMYICTVMYRYRYGYMFVFRTGSHKNPRVFPEGFESGRGDLWCENHGPHHGTLLCILGYIPLVDIEGVCTFFFGNQGIK